MKDFTFGHLLKVTRLRQGFDQREFSKKLGVSQATYSRYEKDKYTPSLDFVITLVKEYDFPLFLLLYNNLQESLADIPIKLENFLEYENNYTYKPLRLKSNKRKNEDLIDIILYLGSWKGKKLYV